jgi:hypothetical protein
MGYFVLFQIEQYNNRIEMRNNINSGISDERVSIINIDNLKVNSPTVYDQNEDELIYKGEIYDIITKKADGTKTVFYAVKDTKEQNLFSALNDHIQANSENTKTTKHPLHSKNSNENFVKIYFYQSTSFLIYPSEKPVLFPTFNLIEYSVDDKAVINPPELA